MQLLMHSLDLLFQKVVEKRRKGMIRSRMVWWVVQRGPPTATQLNRSITSRDRVQGAAARRCSLVRPP